MPGASLTFTRRIDGDFHIGGDADALSAQRENLGPGPWTWLRQVHGAEVVVVTRPGEYAGAAADAAVTDRAGATLAVHTADCVPVLFAARDARVVGAAHAGWRGLTAGVLANTVDAMARLGGSRIEAHVGPHIRARCYEFGSDDLDDVAARFGESVRSTTAWGTPALDLLAGVRAALAERDEIIGVFAEAGCTACEPERFFSHRARADPGRHAATIVLGPS